MKIASLGRLIAERRRAQGLSLRDLAAATSVARSTLAALEAGKLDEIGIAKVNRICAAAEVARAMAAHDSKVKAFSALLPHFYPAEKKRPRARA